MDNTVRQYDVARVWRDCGATVSRARCYKSLGDGRRDGAASTFSLYTVDYSHYTPTIHILIYTPFRAHHTITAAAAAAATTLSTTTAYIPPR